MPTYPQTARDITDLRKKGDIDGAIARFKSAPESERQLPEVRSAAAWVVYERDIKPITVAAQRADETLDVTDKMIADALIAVEKIKTWCSHDPYSPFSAYPTAFLMVARILKAQENYEKLKPFLESIDASQLSSMTSGPYPSSQSQWVTLALDVVKHLFTATNGAEQRISSAEKLLTEMQKIDKSGGLSRNTPSIENNGQVRKLPSQKQRFVLQYTKFLQELGRFDELAKQCKAALDAGLFYRNPNLKWILYRLTLALKDSNPQEALKACDDFVALEERSYSLLLRAEILLACGDSQGALREAVHSLQKVLEKDLPFITKNLRFVAALTEDMEVKKLHIQMVRYVRYEQGQRPSQELENEAKGLNLPPASDAPSFDALRAMWDQINPHSERRRTIGRAVPKNDRTEVNSVQTKDFMNDQGRLGEVIMAKIPTKSGEERFRPVVVIGQNGNQLLVGPLQTNSKHRKAVGISDWTEAGLKQASVFVPFWHIVPNAGQKVLGKLSANDKSKITSVI
jgi:tetratricopeptide (TPR) repeat protein